MNNINDGMSYDLFLRNIMEIKMLSDELEDGWTLQGKMDTENNVFLKKKIIQRHNCLQNYFDSSGNITYEYHVVYSVSYRVPLLCLNTWNFDGKKLTMDETWKYFNKNYSQENMYSVLTEQDHPVLQKPFMVLHPCKTIEIMDNFKLISKNLVISWLSAVGPAINLNFSNEYEKLTRIDS